MSILTRTKAGGLKVKVYSLSLSPYQILHTLPIPTSLSSLDTPATSTASILNETSLLLLSMDRTLHLINLTNSEKPILTLPFSNPIVNVVLDYERCVVLTGSPPSTPYYRTSGTCILTTAISGPKPSTSSPASWSLHIFATKQFNRLMTFEMTRPCFASSPSSSRTPYIAVPSNTVGTVSLHAPSGEILASRGLHQNELSCLSLSPTHLLSTSVTGKSILLSSLPSLEPVKKFYRGTQPAAITVISWNSSFDKFLANGRSGVHVFKLWGSDETDKGEKGTPRRATKSFHDIASDIASGAMISPAKGSATGKSFLFGARSYLKIPLERESALGFCSRGVIAAEATGVVRIFCEETGSTLEECQVEL